MSGLASAEGCRGEPHARPAASHTLEPIRVAAGANAGIDQAVRRPRRPAAFASTSFRFTFNRAPLRLKRQTLKPTTSTSEAVRHVSVTRRRAVALPVKETIVAAVGEETWNRVNATAGEVSGDWVRQWVEQRQPVEQAA